MEMNALSETLATCEHSELRLAQTSNAQRLQIEAEANALFQQRVNMIQNESLAEHRSVVARIELKSARGLPLPDPFRAHHGHQ